MRFAGVLSMRNTGIAFFVLMFVVPLIGANPFHLHIAMMVLIYVILALGLNILIGYAGQLAFANAVIFGIGAYGTGLLMKHFGLSYWLCAPLGALAAMGFGTLLTLPALRLSGIYLALATLAFAQCTVWVMKHWTSVTFGASGFTIPPVDFSLLALDRDHGMYFLAWLCCVLLVWLAKNLIQSPIGRAFAAVRDHEVAAQSLGIDLFRTKALAFAISAFYAGVAGALYAGALSFVGPESFGPDQMILQLAAVVIGGAASIAGSVIGGTLIVLLQEFVKEIKFSIEIAFGALLLMFVLFQSAGVVSLLRRVLPGWHERLHRAPPGAGAGAGVLAVRVEEPKA